MPLPFTPEQFLDGFGWFNTAAWPLHLAMFGVVVGIVVLAFRGGARASRTISVGLALLWLAAAVLQGTAFRGVMPTAIPFAIVFLLEAVLLAVAAIGDRLAFRVHRGPLPALGLALVCYAALLYPAIGALAGHTWPRVPVFGVAPCPNTIFTFGVLLLTERPVPRWLLPIPFLWSLIGIPAAAFLGIAEDWGLPVAGVLATAALALRDRVHRVPRHA
ncbi:MAG TPA: DUF6064 family protein [Anaeromyxobacteraceae bacterium]|nr:DUF6064 family protein [Anaeromyxobacteraceae bacterium]